MSNIELSNVSFGFASKQILSNTSLRLPSQKITAVIGENGVGKTTLLRLIFGDLLPHTGTVKINDQSYHNNALKERALNMAFLSAADDSSFNLTVNQILQIGRYPYSTSIWGTLSKHDKNIIEETKKQFELEAMGKTSYQSLSSGQKQRVRLARVAVQESSILLLDEPFAHLDLQSKLKCIKAFKAIQVHTKNTIIYTTHDCHTLPLFCDQVLSMHPQNRLQLTSPEKAMSSESLSKLFGVSVVTKKEQNHHFISFSL